MKLLNITLTAAAATTTLFLLIGCASKPVKPDTTAATTTNSDDDGTNATFKNTGVYARNLLAAQRDAGAAHDATLRAVDFDGDHLSGAGRDKVAAMVRGLPDVTSPFTVFLNYDGAADHTTRFAAVAHELANDGVTAGRATLVAGPNPGETHTSSLTTSQVYTAKDGTLTLVPFESGGTGDVAGGAKNAQTH